ncbi:hypothetical protein [Brevundimonas sp.]|uniref:hypothetical protein n=1 Tax=Brevundimonas sp. TaxID=1871086 RepID=UPI003D129436
MIDRARIVRWVGPAVFAIMGAIVLRSAVSAGRPVVAEDAPARRQVAIVRLTPGTPEAEGWPAFFACSGLSQDTEVVHATLMRNQGREPLWNGPIQELGSIEVVFTPNDDPSTEQVRRIERQVAANQTRCGF